MLSSYFQVIVRQLTRNKTFSFINVFGLVTGVTVCLFVAQFVWFEKSYEAYNEHADRTYRVNLYNTSNGVFEGITPATVSGLAYAMSQSMTGLQAVARMSSFEKGMVANPAREIENREYAMVYADPALADILSLQFIHGNRQRALMSPDAVVISESMALKYFGTRDVLHNTLDIGFNNNSLEKKSFQVRGVFQDLPANTHARFDFMLPVPREQEWNENWDWSNVSTYVLLADNVTPESLDGAFANLVKQHHQDNTGDRYLLEPIRDIHLHPLEGSGRSQVLNFFSVLGVAILFLAWFNYINLSTARFFERVKEMSVRKVLGTSRKQLVVQLLWEAFLFNALALACALAIFITSWQHVQVWIQQPGINTFLAEPSVWLWFGTILLLATVVSGLYPAIFLSSFTPVHALKGKLFPFMDRAALRRTLIVVQLSVSIILLTAILAVEKQINFMRRQDIGINISQTIIIEEPLLTDGTSINQYEPFRAQLEQLPAVRGVTYGSSFPGAEIDWHRADIHLHEENAGYRYNSRIISIGTEFFDVFELPVLRGRNFDAHRESDKKAMLINEEACRMFGFASHQDALDKYIFVGSRKFEIIGVVKNYHYRSLHHALQPILYMQGYPRNPAYAVKIAPEKMQSTIASIESLWTRAYTGNAFHYYFLDSHFAEQYRAETQTEVILFILAVLAVIISCSGLFGLSLYAVGRRVKEIGIRKVLGATRVEIAALLSRDFVRLIMLSAFIGIPVAYQGVTWWLQRYAFPMPVNLWLFVWPFVAVFVLTLAVISTQTVGAAGQNPVDSIRNE